VFRWTGCEVTARTQRRARDGIEVHAAGLPPDEVTVVDGIPVTTIERTLFDLAAVAPFERVERAFAQADVLRLAGNLGVGDLLERHPGQRGAQTLRTILDDRSLGVGVTQSEFEDRFLALLHASALPRPAKNALVLGLRRDFVWRAPRLVVELDSRSAHDTAHGFEEDRARDRELLVAGWRSLRITWRQLHREPDAVLRDLDALLAA
jgi:very-short-patch-repair endonuclease